MKEKQEHKLTLYQKITKTFTDNHSKWEIIPEFRNTIETFNANNLKVLELKKELEKDTSKLVSGKAQKRLNLINLTIPISNILEVYSLDNKDNSISKKASITKNKLTKSKDSEVIEKSRSIWKITKQLYNESIASNTNNKTKKGRSNISEYGITSQLIDQLDDANKSFQDSILALKDAISYKNKCKKKITATIKANEKLLSNKIDKLMSLFELSDKKFLEEYLSSKHIENKNVTKKEVGVEEKKVSETKQDEVEPVTKASVKSPPTQESKTTSAQKTASAQNKPATAAGKKTTGTTRRSTAGATRKTVVTKEQTTTVETKANDGNKPATFN